MNNTRKKLRNNITEARKALTKQQELLLRLPIEEMEEAFPQGEWSEFTMGRYQFTLPLDFQLVADATRFVVEKGWEIYGDKQTHIWDDKQAARFYNITIFEDDDTSTRFDLDFRSIVEGSTCIVQQIGTKEVPVYEVTCPDGAEENTWE